MTITIKRNWIWECVRPNFPNLSMCVHSYVRFCIRRVIWQNKPSIKTVFFFALIFLLWMNVLAVYKKINKVNILQICNLHFIFCRPSSNQCRNIKFCSTQKLHEFVIIILRQSKVWKFVQKIQSVLIFLISRS